MAGLGASGNRFPVIYMTVAEFLSISPADYGKYKPGTHIIISDRDPAHPLKFLVRTSTSQLTDAAAALAANAAWSAPGSPYMAVGALATVNAFIAGLASPPPDGTFFFITNGAKTPAEAGAGTGTPGYYDAAGPAGPGVYAFQSLLLVTT